MKGKSSQKTQDQNVLLMVVSANPICCFYEKNAVDRGHCTPNGRPCYVEGAGKVDPFAKCRAKDVGKGKWRQVENGPDDHRCTEQKSIDLIKPNQIIYGAQFCLW